MAGRGDRDVERLVAAERAARAAGESAVRWWRDIAGTADNARSDEALDDLFRTALITIRSALGADAVILSGTLCGTSIAALEAQVDQLGAACCDQVVVDVSGLTEVDSVGASVLLGLSHYVAARGGELKIVGATGQVGSTLHASTLPPPRSF